MSTHIRTGAPGAGRQYDDFRDASGSWTFELREYQSDLDSVAPVDVSPAPAPSEAYRVAVFLEGFIEEQQSARNWSAAALDRFDSFDSTVEVEAVAKALRERAEDIE